MGGMKEILYPLNWSATQLSLHAILNSATCREGIILGWIRWGTGKTLGRKEYHSYIDKCSLPIGDQGFLRRKTAPGIHTSLQFSGIKLRTPRLLVGWGDGLSTIVPPFCYFPFPCIISSWGIENFAPRMSWTEMFLSHHLVRSLMVTPHVLPSAEGNSVLLMRAQTARTFYGSKGRNRVRMGLSKNSLNISPPTVTSKPRTMTSEEGLPLASTVSILYHRRSSKER